MTHEKQNKVLNFWFGDDPLKPLQNMNLWFTKNQATDDRIRELFEPLLEEARTDAYFDWTKTPNGALALVVLCDQFPRNIYRDDELAFAWDPVALRAAQIAIGHGFDKRYSVVERCFLYLPFEHSEDIEMQKRSVQLFRDLYDEAQGGEKTFINEALDYAIRHQEIIQKFGRFPHRNEILGRESSRAELEFLKRPGSTF